MNGHAPIVRQRGAALLIATVFLAVIILIIGQVGLRLSSTDITDSALADDALHALFLAESGLERAAQRLANGTACSSLAPDTQIGFGRGDFQIQSAATSSGLCRVRVLGRTLLGGSVRAQRLIEGDIQSASGDSWAVGRNGTVLRYDGSSWSAYSAFTTNDLNGITCVSGICLTVGDSGTIFRWDGSSWSSTVSGTSQNLNRVDCEPSDPAACFAVGRNGTIRRWTGSWGASTSGTSRDLEGVYCGTGRCYSVGRNATIRRWTGGSSWAGELAFSNRHLYGVSCLAGSDTCFAVGRNGTILRRYNFGFFGGIWLGVISGTNRRLNDIDCPTSSRCFVVGDNGVILTTSGGSWSAMSSGTSRRLRGLGCEPGNASNCIAVGDNGTILHWDGSSWTAKASGSSERLHDVAIAGSGGGSVAIQRWREIIP
ncbi:hypothetical protein QVG61_00105 [Thiohalobacter sp. IOR34]|uniref:hypothetical protein n=1 Tax=Thiohalobacter sp. IOR34 TaxID=3057176 RepID=UPI0025B0AD31|nr:hypothetical protein [Thiohalobacter sp. IOR34]WJW75528.1 hypothetical protein QVG61_00105 [Thiohalobacter sp. IOR34]